MIEPTTQERRFAPTLGAIRAAREFVVEAAGDGDEDHAAALALVVSELASNAVLHARTPFVVRVRSASSGVHIAVFDRDGNQPARKDSEAEAVTGRGLAIVESLAREWGVQHEGNGKWVWAVVGNEEGIA